MMHYPYYLLLVVLRASSHTIAAPSGFPTSGNGLWYAEPGTIWSRHYLPVGNGFLAAMTPGGTTQELTQLNIESLWSGGPQADPSYNGGNKQPSERLNMAQDMQIIRNNIFASKNGTIGDVEVLSTDAGAYGSYSGAGYLISTIIDPPSPNISEFGRFLDMDNGIAKATWTQSNSTFTRETFCSFPAKVCIQSISATLDSGFAQTYALGSISGLPTPNITCSDNSTLRMTGLVAQPGMAYEILARVIAPTGKVSCTATSEGNATVSVSDADKSWVIWAGGTNYDMNAGDAAHNYSFLGVDPHDALVSIVDSASSKSYASLLSEHRSDFSNIVNSKFSLDLGHTPDLNTPTDELRNQYQTDIGNPYLEWLAFNFGRYLLASSARGELPANLQGKWAADTSNPWSADYHANINLQMNYWSAESTGLNVTQSLFNYIEKTWAPRGAYTANVLYNITRGWVTHDEMNIFGHTGMKGGGNTAQWADYPESNAWMMIHVWDHFDYTADVSWWRTQGYPLLKSVASFHLDKIILDKHFNDGTLVVVPCNSPEQIPITLGCSHAQQLIWQLFNAVEKGFTAAGDADMAFLEEVKTKKAKMDKGIHIGSWGQLQEWKVDLDSPTDTHRHLSHLIGLYPGYAVASYNSSLQGFQNGKSNLSISQVLQAAQTSLIHRGNGTGPDADAGWEKVWRAACWAQLENAEEFYHELTYALERNFGENLFSLYDPGDADPIFQIDANLGFPGAVMNAIIQAPDTPLLSQPLKLVLLPALPQAWAVRGSITGARIRGGISLDMSWEAGRPSNVALMIDSSDLKAGASEEKRVVQVIFGGKTYTEFIPKPGERRVVTGF